MPSVSPLDCPDRGISPLDPTAPDLHYRLVLRTRHMSLLPFWGNLHLYAGVINTIQHNRMQHRWNWSYWKIFHVTSCSLNSFKTMPFTISPVTWLVNMTKIITLQLKWFITARCTTVQARSCYRFLSVRPSVCLSVCLWRWWIMTT